MEHIETQIQDKFGGRLRTRVNGVLIENDKILMIKHRMSSSRVFWNVPGGGMEFGSSITMNLEREFLEETGLEVETGEFLGVTEFLEPPLHAVELYFEVKLKKGRLALGTDPELEGHQQLLEELKFMDIKEIQAIPRAEKHQYFWNINSTKDVRIWKGYFNFENKCIK
ncbi:hypothetical protein GCM10007049_20580 [Echinicola pacifica]|uniref:Nudix hydrolase domain-containing protein n=1 Tax=Echinicola pacifica TaxID=346377 RepID=A0A918Q1M5_9BACT|nr:NUDIX domain-containing protein [Echinicola pacifica]GGZ27623.1 hypothetical protein GCM10007049_20580 [Echinicola pacifica]